MSLCQSSLSSFECERTAYKKRSIRVIKEKKTEIKKLQSFRSSTPFERIDNKLNNSQSNSRQSSSSSIRNLVYNQDDEKGSIRSKKSCSSKTRLNVIGDTIIKLEPIVTQPLLHQKMMTQLTVNYDENIEFPPIRKESEIPTPENLKALSDICTSESENSAISRSFDRSCDNFGKLLTFETDVASSKNESITNLYEGDCEFEYKDSDEVSKNMPDFLLSLRTYVEQGRKRNEKEVIQAIDKIYNLLKDQNAFMSIINFRIRLLKLLFRLLDSNFPSLSLHTMKLLFKMRIKDKNVLSIFNLILKLMNNEDFDYNDQEFCEVLFEAIEESFQTCYKDLILQGLKILGEMTQSNQINIVQIGKVVDILLRCLKDMNSLVSIELIEGDYFEIVTQVIFLLHNINKVTNSWECLKELELQIEILKILKYDSTTTHCLQVVLGFVSDIAESEDGCNNLAQCPGSLLSLLLTQLKNRMFYLSITEEICFILEAISSKNGRTALTLAMSEEFGNLIIVLDEYMKEHLQCKEEASNKFRTISSGCLVNHNTIFEAISKILCVWTNISLHPQAAQYLLSQENFMSHLLEVIQVYSMPHIMTNCESNPLSYFLMVLGNITYSIPQDSFICNYIAEEVISLLDDHFPFDVRFESANIIRNLTHFSSTRKYIKENLLLPAFIRLLDKKDKNFNLTVLGIIMNILLDKTSRTIFKEEQGIEKVLHMLHISIERDWNRSALLCQIIWNYCGGEKADTIAISKIEAHHLIKCLSHYISAENMKSLGNETEWKNEFYPVANNLLELIQKKYSTIV